jgi:hypothetical protein
MKEGYPVLEYTKTLWLSANHIPRIFILQRQIANRMRL